MDLNMFAPIFHDLPLVDRLNLGVRAPAPWLVTGEDRVRVTVRNGLAGVGVTVSGRFLTMEGQVTPIVYEFTPTSDLVGTAIEFALGDGWILNLTARVTAGTPQEGDTFAVVQIIRGATPSAIVLGTLISAFVTDTTDAAWPGSILTSSAAGPGSLRLLTGADPAAGVEWTLTVPASTRLRLRTLSSVLVTDATVANREASIVITAGGQIVASIPAGVAHVASTARRYSAYQAAVRGAGAVSLDLAVPIPYLELRAGDTITSVTTNLQAGDNWAAPQAWGERVLDA